MRWQRLFAQGRYGEAETQARALTARIPTHGIGWKALGTALKLQGRNAEALPPLQKAAGLPSSSMRVILNRCRIWQFLHRMR